MTKITRLLLALGLSTSITSGAVAQNAVYFNGSSYYMANPGVIDDMPAAPVATGILSYWYKGTTAPSTNCGNTIVEAFTGATSGQVFWVNQVFNPITSDPELEILIVNYAVNPSTRSNKIMTAPLPYDGLWHNIIITWNGNPAPGPPPEYGFYLDRIQEPYSSVYIQQNVNFTTDFHKLYWYVGGNPNCDEPAGINLAEVFLYLSSVNVLIDPYNTMTLSNMVFWNPHIPSQIEPMWAGTEGELIFNDPAAIYLSGNSTPHGFPYNHAKSFVVGAGYPAQATSDPFGPGPHP